MNKDTFALTPECTILWPSIFEPESFKGGEEKYRAVLLIDKTADFSALNAAIIAARNQKFPGKDAEFFKTLRYPIRNGAEKAVDQDGKPDKASIFHDRCYLSVKSNFQPQVVDKFNQPILDPKDIYGGCRVVVLLAFFGYDRLGNRGVSCSMRAVMKIADGSPIGGGKLNTAQVFADYVQQVSPADMLKNDPGKPSVFGFPKKENLKDFYSDPAEDIQY